MADNVLLPRDTQDMDHERRYQRILSEGRSQHSDQAMKSKQSKQFIEKARELGCDESEEAFDRALGKVASAPAPKTVKARKAPKARRKRKA